MCTSHCFKWSPFPPNKVGRIAQHVWKGELKFPPFQAIVQKRPLLSYRFKEVFIGYFLWPFYLLCHSSPVLTFETKVWLTGVQSPYSLTKNNPGQDMNFSLYGYSLLKLLCITLFQSRYKKVCTFCIRRKHICCLQNSWSCLYIQCVGMYGVVTHGERNVLL